MTHHAEANTWVALQYLRLITLGTDNMEITKSELNDYINPMIGIEVNDNGRFLDDVGIDCLDA